MTQGMGVQAAMNGVQTNRAATPASTAAADAASAIPAAPVDAAATDAAAQSVPATTTFTAEPAIPSPQSRVVQRLLERNAEIYAPRLARVPLPERPLDAERAQPKKPAGPMTAPRTLDGGRSPLAGASLFDGAESARLLGNAPDDAGESHVAASAAEGAWRMPTRHGLVAYTTTPQGTPAYLTHERWLHIRENHMDVAPQPRGKRTTTYWPTTHAVEQPSMNEQQVIGVIVDAARNGTLRTEVRDTRMSEYDLPADQRAAYGVSEAKVSMAPDGLVLSAYPGAGRNVLAVYELDEADHAELQRATAQAANVAADEADSRLFKTNIASTTFG